MSDDIFEKTAMSDTQSLIAERNGLELIRRNLLDNAITQIGLPDVIRLQGNRLTLSRIQSVRPQAAHWQNLAQGLARLHSIQQKQYGYHANNFIGLSPQKNQLTSNWGTFFVQYRLRFQIDRLSNKTLQKTAEHILATKTQTLTSFLNASCHQASLLHGDLWRGNVMFSNADKAWLIDPAVYYGDADADIAMTELFSGFDDTFYSTYYQTRPRQPDYPIKREIYNLYHNLNHLNLFGASYQPACEQGLKLIEQI